MRVEFLAACTEIINGMGTTSNMHCNLKIVFCCLYLIAGMKMP